ncbi:hypothetical protein SK128_011530, partial [Halocaridina rubra]
MIRPNLKKGSPPPTDFMMDIFNELCPGKDYTNGIDLQVAEILPDPRTLKTHLPLSLLPPTVIDTSKVVYVIRNPKDVIISWHHFVRIAKIMNYKGSFEDFVQFFIDGDMLYGPYCKHVREAWEKRTHPNVHILFYENLKSNIMEELRKLNAFLETKCTEGQLQNIAEYTTFENMKRRDDKWDAERPQPRVLNLSPQEQERERKRRAVVEAEGGFYRK